MKVFRIKQRRNIVKVKALIVTMVLLLFSSALLTGCKANPIVSSEWQTIDGEGGLFAEGGYYYASYSDFLYFLDISNGNDVCLCSKIGCIHDTKPGYPEEHCEARLTGILVCYWDSGIYTIDAHNYGCYLYRRNADGTGEQQVMELCVEYKEAQKEVANLKTLFADGYIYYVASIQGITEENGAIVSETESYVLKRIDLHSKKEEEILSSPKELSISLVAARGNSVLYTEWYIPDHNRDNYLDAIMNSVEKLILLDINTGERKVILEKKYSQGYEIEAVVDNKILYSTLESGTLDDGQWACRSLNIDTGEDTLLHHMDIDYINEHLGWRLVLDSENELGWAYILVDLKTGKDLPMEFSGNISILNMSESIAIVFRSEPKTDGSGSVRILSFCTLDSLMDGLQMEDLIDFYIRQPGPKS